MNYHEIAFSDASKHFQERYGSRASYARMEQFKFTDGLTDSEIDFISLQDNFFFATVGENNFPYIQRSKNKNMSSHMRKKVAQD